ncbi:MAG: hypothetical protein JRN15_00065 [Nitrososphaerota archaeon]|nr:hypothetical protein [Nitrososphaerota archaeon]
MSKASVTLDGPSSLEIASTARSEEKTIRAFVNEWLLVATKLSKQGWNTTKLESLCDAFTLMKEMDVITLPSDFVDDLVAREYKTDKQGLFQMFREMGTQVADVVKIDSPNMHGLAKVANEFLSLLPLKMFKISMDDRENCLEIVVVGVGKRIESTECAFEMLEAFLNSYGYSVTNQQINVGTIMVQASRHNSGTSSIA